MKVLRKKCKFFPFLLVQALVPFFVQAGENFFLKILVRILPKLSNFGGIKLKILFWLAEGIFDLNLPISKFSFDVQKFLRITYENFPTHEFFFFQN